MADTPWTPGPWRNVAGELVGADGQRVVLAAFRGGLVSAHGNPRAVANTAIAEAAPEMAEVLEELASDLEAEINANARYAYRDRYPTEQKAWERDMEPVHRARALLARIKGKAS